MIGHKKLRVLITTQPFLGHLRPLVPLALELQRVGHEVLVSASPEIGPAVQRYGFAFAPLGPSGPIDLGRIGVTGESDPLRIEVEVLANLSVEVTLGDAIDTVKRFGPDLIVRDSAEFAGHLAGDLAGIPQAVLDTSLASSLYTRRSAFVKALEPHRRGLGLAPDPSAERLFGQLFVTFMPPAFFEPGEMPRDAVHFRHRNPPFEPLPAEVLKALTVGKRPKPSIFVSFGTVANATRVLVQICRAAADLETTTIVKTMPQNDGLMRRRFRQSGIVFARDVPPPSVLSYVDLFVTHGGYNAVKESLLAGVPMVVLPQFGDQEFIAERCVSLGFAQEVDPGHASSEELREALDSTVASRSMRARIQEFRSLMSSLPPIESLVPGLQMLAQ